MQIQPARGQPLGEDPLESGPGGDVSDFGFANRGSDIAIWRQVDSDRVALVPIRRNLQDRRPAQPAVGDQHLFPESLMIRGNDDFRGDACQIAILLAIAGSQHERHKCGSRGLDLQPKLPCEVISQRSRSQFWNRKSAGRHHQDRRMELAGLRADDKLVCASNVMNVAVQNDLYPRSAAFDFEHFHDVASGTVAEELAERFLVIWDVMLLDQRDEVRGRVPGQRRFREVRICGKEILRLAIKVGEITAASAGDQNLLAGTIRALQNRRRAARVCRPRSRTAARRLRRPELPHQICGPSVFESLRPVKFAANDYYIPGRADLPFLDR